MSIINFTVKFDLFASQTDSGDMGADSDTVALTGDVTFTPLFTDEKPVLAPGYAPRPAGFKLRPIVGYLDSDGQLKSAKSGSVGVRLPANDPVLQLASLNYRVSFNVKTPVGESVVVSDGFFSAPSSDVIVNLADVMEPTGFQSITVPGELSVFGQNLISAVNPSDARDVLVAVSDYDFRLDDTRVPTDGSVTLAKLDPVLADNVDGLNGPNFSTSSVGVLNSGNVTNAVTKNTSYGVRHYTNSEVPFYGVRMESAAGGNYLQLGGGFSTGNAATLIQFFTASNGTTPTGVLTGQLTPSGLSIGGNALSDISVAINADSGEYRSLRFQSGGVTRWNVRTNNAAESGGDAGSNFEIQSCTDAGSGKSIVVSISRSSGAVTFGGLVVTPASTTSTSGLRLPHGTAPTSPVNGDVWTTTSGLFYRLNGSTVQAVGNSDSAALTNKDLTSATNLFPTFNQNTTGSAATLTTARTVRTDLGSTSTASFDGSANITPGVTGTLPVGNGGTGASTLTGLVKGNGTSAMTAATAGTDYLTTEDVHTLVNQISSGESTMPRYNIIGSAGTGSGSLRLTYFTATKTETISQIRIICGATAAAGATLIRVGIYSVDPSTGDLTLVASTANDTTLLAATSTAYTKSLSASFSKTRGSRYAVGLLFIGTTAPSIFGHASMQAAEAGIAPRLGGLLLSQTDLPSSITDASLSAQANLHYVALVP